MRVGCPIQRSSDHSPVTGSPKLIAGSHVFHRLCTPRHPPCALVGLTTPTRRRALGSCDLGPGSGVACSTNADTIHMYACALDSVIAVTSEWSLGRPSSRPPVYAPGQTSIIRPYPVVNDAQPCSVIRGVGPDRPQFLRRPFGSAPAIG